jgi:predicted phage terminase large subunit-like protein
MAEPVLDNFEGNACLCAQARVRVAQPMQRDRRDLCSLDAVEHRPTEVPWVHCRAVSASEDEVPIPIRGSEKRLLLLLRCLVRIENRNERQSDILLVENEGMGSRVIGSLEGRSLPIQVCDPVKSKIERAAASAPLCEEGRVWLPAFYTPWREQWEKEVFSFPSSRFNDQVDAFSWALSWIFRIQRARLADAAFNRQLDSFSLFR